MQARRASTSLIALVVAVLLIAPPGASALRVTFDPSGNGQYKLEADYKDYVTPEANRVALTTLTPGGGSPDLVIGDVAAGISDPLPPFCPRVDPTIIRCPISLISQVNVDLGPGNDTLSASRFDQAVAAYWRGVNRYSLGSGNDVALGGPFPNVIYGGPGRDLIQGGQLGDRLFGGAQNDFLVGLGGSDLFQCGKGPHDRFNDGPGRDLVNVRTCEARVHKEFVP